MAKGTPKVIQSIIEISIPYVSCINALKTIFGAVPTRVDIPPIVAAYAIPSINDVSKYVISFSVKPGIVLLTTEHTAKPIGNSIRVVEVFITNILIKAAIVIKPAINFGPLDPAAIIICRAILLWRPDLSIARANMKPPKNKYILGFAYGIAASLNETIPINGNNAKGRRAVTATGMASVAHQIAIKLTIAATDQPSELRPWGAGIISIRIKTNKPNINPFFL